MDNKQDQLEELLLDWEQQRLQGEELSVEELCSDNPDLMPELSKMVSRLKEMDWLEHDEEPDDEFLQLPDFSTVSGHADETDLPECKISLDAFCQRLIGSELMDEARVGALTEGISAEDVQSFAFRLVDGNKLTRFQATALLEGRDIPLVLDRYVLLDEIGKGGMGVVYKALHQPMDRVVALKILPKETVDSPEKVKRFQREVKAAAKLTHENIVVAYDAREDKGVHFLVMELVVGTDLAAFVQKHGPVSSAKAVDYVAQAARGLAHAHGMGVIHRDIKPGNLLLSRKGSIKILDMGLARFDGGDPENEDTLSMDLTQAGMVLGTITYLAPEQALDTRQADARSDIYSLGCTLWYLLTGRVVYSETSPMKTIMAHREGKIPSLCDERKAVPADLDAIFQKMVAKKPVDRFQSMSELILALEGLDIADEEGSQPVFTGSQVLQDTVTQRDTSRELFEPSVASGSGTPPKQRWGFIAAGLIGLVALLAGLIIKLQTPAGTIVLEIDQPEIVGAQVLIDGRKSITIKTGNGKETISVKPDEKKHTLEVRMAGFHAFMKEFTYDAGNEKKIRVTLLPLDAVADTNVNVIEPSDALSGREAITSAAFALAFDGIDDQVHVENFNYDGRSPLTVEAVVEVKQGHPSTVFSTWSPGYVKLDYDGRDWRFWNSSALAGRGVAVITPHASGPIHVAGVWDGRQCNLFVDGKRQTTRPLTLRLGPQRGANATVVGANPDGQVALKGVLHELRVSNTARYDTDFSVSETLSSDDDTMFHYRVDAGEGSTLADTSGNGRNGAISGAAWISLEEKGRTDSEIGRYEGIATGEWIPILEVSPPSNHESVHYQDGTLRLANVHLVKPDFIGRDMIMRARMKKVSGQNVNFKLRSRDSGNTYSFWINSEHLMGIGKTIGNKHTNLGKATPDGIVLDSEGFLEVAFAAIGDRLRVFVNDRKVFDLRDDSLPDGYPALKAIGVSEFKDVEVMFLDNHSPTDVLTSGLWRWSNPRLSGAPVDPENSDVVGMQLVRGLALFNFASNRAGGEGGYDLYGGWLSEDVERVNEIESWGRDVNSMANESAVAATIGLRQIIFQRSQPGNLRSSDLWVGRRESASIELFEDCAPLEAPLNSGDFDGMPTLSSNGMTMIYASHRRGGKGGSDLWITTRTSLETPFSEPRNLGLPVNTDQHESWPCLSADGRALIFQRFSGRFETLADTTDAKDGELWIATRSTTNNPFGRPMKLDARINNGDPVSCSALSTDGRTLFFKRGGRIWVSHRVSTDDSENVFHRPD